MYKTLRGLGVPYPLFVNNSDYTNVFQALQYAEYELVSLRERACTLEAENNFMLSLIERNLIKDNNDIH